MRASYRSVSVPSATLTVKAEANPRLYDVYLLLDVLHLYDPLGAARIRTDGFGAIVVDGPPLEDVARLERVVLEALPFAYDERVGGWRYAPKERKSAEGGA